MLEDTLDGTDTLFLRMTICVDDSYVWMTIIAWMVDYKVMVEIGNMLLF